MKHNKWITKAGREFLIAMRDGEDNYAISEGLIVYVDSRRFSRATLQCLLRLCLVSLDSYSKDKPQIWTLNEDGERIIDDVNFEPPIVAVLRKELQAVNR